MFSKYIKNNTLSKKHIIIPCLTLFFLILLIASINYILCFDKERVSKHYTLNDDWTIYINNEVHSHVSLDTFTFSPVSKGDRIVLEKQVPTQQTFQHSAALRFFSRHSAVQMFIGDTLVYEYGIDRAKNNLMLGSGYHFMDFPKAYQSESIKIILLPSENNAFSQIESIEIYTWKTIYRNLLIENRLPLFLGVFLTVFGASMFLFACFSIMFTRRFLKLAYISLFSICIGIWTLCYHHIISCFSAPIYLASMLEYIAFYTGPIPMAFYMRDSVKSLGNKYLLYFYHFLMALVILVNTTVIYLHCANIIHMSSVLTFAQIFLVLLLIFTVVIITLNFKKNKENPLYLLGILLITLCVGYDLFSYLLKRYFSYGRLSFNGASSVGMIFFIFILFGNFYFSLAKNIRLEAERNALRDSAYTDSLTALKNRRFCSEYMNNADMDKGYWFGCFDINNLKTINDTYGHAKGDQLIKNAAAILSETFSNYGVVSRIGGDEFVVIIESPSVSDIDRLYQEFQTNVDKANNETPDLLLSIAFGSCYSKERPNASLEQVYQLADQKMYEVKRVMKQA